MEQSHDERREGQADSASVSVREVRPQVGSATAPEGVLVVQEQVLERPEGDGPARPSPQDLRATYRAWWNMLDRCLNEKCDSWKRYGGRGIKACDRWRVSYDAFLTDMGVRPGAGLSLDRIDNNGDYEPGNCRWATSKQQHDNQRYGNKRKVTIEWQGERVYITELSKRLGLPYATLYGRALRGRGIEDLLRGSREGQGRGRR